MNFLIIAIDCWRADRLGSGRSLSATPHLCGLAKRASVFSQAISACVTTTPSFASLLTGCYPPQHGVFSLHGYRLSEYCPTLVESFQRAGYHTFAEVTGPLLELVGLNRGFDSYHCRGQKEYLSGAWGRKLIEEFRGQRFPEPWFGLVHLWELHEPQFVPPLYDHPQYGLTPYDRALAGLDAALEPLLAALPKDTVIVFLGDHGESLGLLEQYPDRIRQGIQRRLGRLWECDYINQNSNGRKGFGHQLLRRLARPWRPTSRYQYYRQWQYGHGWHLYDELVRVPLLFFGPSFPDRRIERLVRTVDVLPTLLESAGLPMPTRLHGRSICELLDNKEAPSRSAYLEAAGSCLPDRSFWLRGLRTDRHKYIYTPFSHNPVAELYDLVNDPQERNNVIDEHPEVAARLHAECTTIAKESHPAVGESGMSIEDEAVLADRLRQLGYME
jgi:arylsulfatase A-like enzyme